KPVIADTGRAQVEEPRAQFVVGSDAKQPAPAFHLDEQAVRRRPRQARSFHDPGQCEVLGLLDGVEYQAEAVKHRRALSGADAVHDRSPFSPAPAHIRSPASGRARAPTLELSGPARPQVASTIVGSR